MITKTIERPVRVSADCLSVELSDGSGFVLGAVQGEIYIEVLPAQRRPEDERLSTTMSGEEFYELLRLVTQEAGDVP